MTTRKSFNAKTNTAAAAKPAPAGFITVSAPPSQIPLDKLQISDRNVRRIKAGLTIEGLADSIARRTLLTSLSVREKLDESGNPTGSYEVQAGGRRLRALQLLAKQKRIPADAPVPCIVKTGGLTEDDSLSENSDREALHPIDQFRAFASLRDQDMSIEDIAAAYQVTAAYVKQLLRLDSASDKLIKAYANDDIDLEQLKAFCATNDHKRQDEVLRLISKGNHYGQAWHIRRLMTETTISAKDRRARFVGLKAYKNAGGTVIHDLFEQNEPGYLQNPEILTRLMNEKLADAQASVVADGWKWAELCVDGNVWDLKRGLHVLPDEARLSPKDLKRRSALSEEYDRLIEALDDDSDTADADQARLDQIEAKIDAIDSKPPHYSAESKAIAGAIVSLDHDGKLDIFYGYVRPEDMPADPDSPEAAKSSAIKAKPAEYTVAGKPLKEGLVRDLTAYRTVAIRNAVAQNFPAAFLTALHAMCLNVFHRGTTNSCAQISLQEGYAVSVPGLGDFEPRKAIDARHDEWQARLPQDSDELWAYLGDLSDHDRAALFAHCVSLTLNAVCNKFQPRRNERHHADLLSASVGLDIAQTGWKTDAENYFKRINKAQILDAIRDAKGEQAAILIGGFKHEQMAIEAARLIEDTNWIPPVLRNGASTSIPESPLANEEDAAAPLPDFLAVDPEGPQPAQAA